MTLIYLQMKDVGETFKKLGFYFATVVIGLFIHGGITLPIIMCEHFSAKGVVYVWRVKTSTIIVRDGEVPQMTTSPQSTSPRIWEDLAPGTGPHYA